MAALTVDFRKHRGPTPADDMAAQIITDCGNFTHCHTHTFAHTAKFVPSGVHWLVTGAVPSRGHPLYPFTWVHICTLAVCTFKGKYVPLRTKLYLIVLWYHNVPFEKGENLSF